MDNRKFPMDRQLDMMDCGPVCLKMIARFYGKYYSLQYLRNLCGNTRQGVYIDSLWQRGSSKIRFTLAGADLKVQNEKNLFQAMLKRPLMNQLVKKMREAKLFSSESLPKCQN